MAAGFHIPAELHAPVDAKPLGLQLQDITIFNVISNSWAHRQGLAAGDKLVSVNTQPIKTMPREEVLAVLRSARPLQLGFLLFVPYAKVNARKPRLYQESSNTLIKPPQQLPISPVHRAHRKSLRVVVGSCKHPKNVFQMREFNSMQWRHGIVCDWCGQRTDFLQSNRKIFACEVCNVFLCDFCGEDPNTGVTKFDVEPWFLEDARAQRRRAACETPEVRGRATVPAVRSFGYANTGNSPERDVGIKKAVGTVVKDSVVDFPKENSARPAIHAAVKEWSAFSSTRSVFDTQTTSTLLEDDNKRASLVPFSVSPEHKNDHAPAEAKPRPIDASARSTPTKRKTCISTQSSPSTSLPSKQTRSNSSPTHKLPASAQRKPSISPHEPSISPHEPSIPSGRLSPKRPRSTSSPTSNLTFAESNPTISSHKPSVSGASHSPVWCEQRLSPSLGRKPSSGSSAGGTRSATTVCPKSRGKRTTPSHPSRTTSDARKSDVIAHPRSPPPACASPSSTSPLKAATAPTHSSQQTAKASASQRPCVAQIRKAEAKRRSRTSLSGMTRQKEREPRSVTLTSFPLSSTRWAPSTMSLQKASAKHWGIRSSPQTAKASASQRSPSLRIRETAAESRSRLTWSGVRPQKKRESCGATTASPSNAIQAQSRRTAMKSASAATPARGAVGCTPRVAVKAGALTAAPRVRPPMMTPPDFGGSRRSGSASAKMTHPPPPKSAPAVPHAMIWSHIAAQPPYRMTMKAAPLQPQEKSQQFQPPERDRAEPRDSGERTASATQSPCPQASQPQEGLELAADILVGWDVMSDAAKAEMTRDSPPPPYYEQPRAQTRDDADSAMPQPRADAQPPGHNKQSCPHLSDDTGTVDSQRLGGATLTDHYEQERLRGCNKDHGDAPLILRGAVRHRRLRRTRTCAYTDHATRIAESMAQALLSPSPSMATPRNGSRDPPAPTPPSSRRDARQLRHLQQSTSPASLSLSPQPHRSQRGASPMSLSLFSRSQQSPRSALATPLSWSPRSRQSGLTESPMSLSLSPQSGQKCSKSVAPEVSSSRVSSPYVPSICILSPRVSSLRASSPHWSSARVSSPRLSSTCVSIPRVPSAQVSSARISSPHARSNSDAIKTVASPSGTKIKKQPLQNVSRLGSLAAFSQRNVSCNRGFSHCTNASQAWNHRKKMLRGPLNKQNKVTFPLAAPTISKAKVKKQINDSAILNKCPLETKEEGKCRGRKIVEKMVKTASEEGVPARERYLTAHRQPGTTSATAYRRKYDPRASV